MKKTVMKISVLAWALTLVFSCTPKDPKEVIKRVDDKIYYPERTSLLSVSCQVQTPYLGEMFGRLKKDVPGSEKILDQLKIDISYFWRNSKEGKYIINGVPGELSALRTSISEVFKGTDILVMPPSEQKQFEPFTLSLQKENDKLVVTGINPDKKSDFAEYYLTVNPKNWMVLERKFVSKEFISRSTPYFDTWKDKRYVVKIETTQDLKEKSEEETGFQSLVEVSYQEVDGYRLVKTLTYRFTKPGTGEKVVGPVELNFENCKINPTTPREFSMPGKVVFTEPQNAPRMIPEPQKPIKKGPEPKAKARPAGKAKNRSH
jgi:hypothetical protein